MRVFVILKEDQGYLGCGREIGGGATIESIHKSYESAVKHIQETYEGVYESAFYPEDGQIDDFKWFDQNGNEHLYDLSIYEKELA